MSPHRYGYNNMTDGRTSDKFSRQGICRNDLGVIVQNVSHKCFTARKAQPKAALSNLLRLLSPLVSVFDLTCFLLSMFCSDPFSLVLVFNPLFPTKYSKVMSFSYTKSAKLSYQFSTVSFSTITSEILTN